MLLESEKWLRWRSCWGEDVDETEKLLKWKRW